MNRLKIELYTRRKTVTAQSPLESLREVVRKAVVEAAPSWTPEEVDELVSEMMEVAEAVL